MRKATWVIALGMGLAVATPAWAQRTVTFGGATTATTNVPVDTSHTSVPMPRMELTRPQPSGIRAFLGRLWPFGGSSPQATPGGNALRSLKPQNTNPKQ